MYSTHDDASGNAGKFAHTAGKYFNDAEKDKGIQTSQDARFYKLSSTFPKFTNKDKPLVIQYSVKHEQSQDCGGAYIKVGPGPLDQEKFEGETKYKYVETRPSSSLDLTDRSRATLAQSDSMKI